MINTPRRLSAALVDLIQQATGDFSEGVSTTQNAMLKSMLSLTRQLKVDKNGNIKRTAENMKTLARLKRDLKGTVLTKAYKGRVEKFMRQYGIIGNLNDEYFSFLVDAFRPNKAIFDALKEDAIEQTLSAFTEAGLDANILEPARKILNDNIRNGGSVFDLEEQLRQFIVGIPDKRLGRLESYTGQMTRDLLNQFSANYHFNTTSDLGLQFYLYSGGTVQDSRTFCVERAGKIYHEEEIKAWASLDWQGKTTGTTSTTIFIFRGGYNCMHHFGAIATNAVPQFVLERAAGKGFIKLPKDLPEPVTGGTDGVAPDGFQFGPDLPRSVRDKFTFSGNHPNMPDNFADYGVDLPDQFWDQFKGKQKLSSKAKGAYFDPRSKTIMIPNGSRFANSEYYKRTIFSHEGGHSWHFESGIITYTEASDGMKEIYKDFRAALKKQLGKVSDWDLPLQGLRRKESGFLDSLWVSEDGTKNISLIDHFTDKFKGAYSKRDIYEMLGSTADTLAALTKGRKGYGHPKNYWKKLPNGEFMELFAHLNENLWQGNPVFKELYPEIYEMGIKFMQNLYGL